MDLQREYEEAEQRYKELESIVAKRIAGTIDPQSGCPDEVLKQHLQILGLYINILKERLKYE